MGSKLGLLGKLFLGLGLGLLAFLSSSFLNLGLSTAAFSFLHASFLGIGLCVRNRSGLLLPAFRISSLRELLPDLGLISTALGCSVDTQHPASVASTDFGSCVFFFRCRWRSFDIVSSLETKGLIHRLHHTAPRKIIGPIEDEAIHFHQVEKYGEERSIYSDLTYDNWESWKKAMYETFCFQGGDDIEAAPSASKKKNTRTEVCGSHRCRVLCVNRTSQSSGDESEVREKFT
jgi:hypothetical protein